LRRGEREQPRWHFAAKRQLPYVCADTAADAGAADASANTGASDACADAAAVWRVPA